MRGPLDENWDSRMVDGFLQSLYPLVVSMGTEEGMILAFNRSHDHQRFSCNAVDEGAL